MEYAWSAGLDTLDTAIVYGESERRLGEVGVSQWHIISKLPMLPENCADIAGWVYEAVSGSLDRLKISRLSGLLLHQPQNLLGPQGAALYDAMIVLKERGLVERLGVSIYSPDELDVLWPRFQLELVQAPYNIIDRRLATSGWLEKLHHAGVEVHVRSVFLQGLLLMEKVMRPTSFDRWQPLWEQWEHWLDAQSLTPLQACLAFAGAQAEIDRVIVGVDTQIQLQEIVNAADTLVLPPAALMSEDLDLINPSRWNTL